MANLGISDIKITESGQTISGTSESDVINISGIIDFLELPETAFTINAGAGDDKITGTQFHNFINGEAGNDKIYAGDTVGFEEIDGGEGEDTVLLNFNPFYNLTSYTNENGVIRLTTNVGTVTTISNVESFVFSLVNARSIRYSFAENFSFTLTADELETFVSKIDLQQNASIPADQMSIIAEYTKDGKGFFFATDGDPNGYLIGGDLNFVSITVGEDGLNFSGIDLGTDFQYSMIAVQASASDLLSGLSIGGVDPLSDSSLHSQNLDANAATTITTLLPKLNINGQTITPETYKGAVENLDYQYIGSDDSEAALGSIRDDFINLLGGDDAVDGGLGNDVLDGGAGSNFLTGGSGIDTFFLDGRSGDITWSTISDFDGDEVNIWGWNEGVSQLLLTEESAGADGFKGATFHYDLNNDGSIDTSITFSGVSLAAVPNGTAKVIEENGYLLFSPYEGAFLLP